MIGRGGPGLLSLLLSFFLLITRLIFSSCTLQKGASGLGVRDVDSSSMTLPLRFTAGETIRILSIALLIVYKVIWIQVNEEEQK